MFSLNICIFFLVATVLIVISVNYSDLNERLEAVDTTELNLDRDFFDVNSSLLHQDPYSIPQMQK